MANALRPFVFVDGDADRNWRVFDEASKTKHLTNLSITSPTGSPVVKSGTFTLYGPLVVYNLWIYVPSGAGWTTSSYINIPYPELLTTAPSAMAWHRGEVTSYPSGAAITTTMFNSNTYPNRLNFAGAYTAASNTDTFAQGMYYRG